MERVEGLAIGLNLDTLQLERGLTGLKDKLKTVDSEMKANLSAFDRGDKSIEKYETRVQGLNKKLEVHKRVVQQAKVEYEKMVQEHGEGSKQAEAAARTYNNQAASLNNLQRSVTRAEAGLFDLKEEQRLATSNWAKFGQETEKAGEKLNGFGRSLTDIGQSMSMSITAPVLGAFAAVTKGTEELRGDLAKLDANAFSSGFNVDVMRKELEKINAIAPDVNANVEGLSNLMATPFSEQGLSQAVDLLSGASIKFSETLKFEGLADGLQETLATGAAIGPFAELLERSGINLDTFNAGLTDAIKNGTEEQYVLKTLADTGLGGLNEEFRKNNEGLVESRQASMQFQQSIAELGTTLTPIATEITQGITGVVDKFNSLDSSTQNTILAFAGIAAVMGPVITFGGMFTMMLRNIVSGMAPVISNISKAGGLLKWLRLGFTALTGPVGLTIGIITLLATGFIGLYKNSETFRNGVTSLGSKLQEFGQNVLSFLAPAIESVKQFFLEQFSVIKQFWQDNSSTIIQALSNVGMMASKIFQGISSVIQFIMPFILGIIKSVWGNIQGVISGSLNVLMGLVKVFSGLFTGDFRKMWEGLKQIFSGAIQFIWNFIQLNMFGKILSFGKVFASSFKNVFSGLWTNVKTIFSTGVSNVKNFAVNGFNSMKSSVGTIMTNMKTSVSKVFTDIVDGAKALPGKIGDGIKSMAGKVVSGITSLKNKMAETLGEGVNGAIGGVNWVLKKINVKELPLWPIPQYAKGTDGHPGGLAVLGDGKMEELFVTPSGYMGLSPDRDTLMNLPKGTHVFSGPQTKQLMDEGTIPQYSGGTVGKWFKKKGQQLSAGAGKLKDKAIDTAQAGAQKVKDVALDVWSYLDNPKELMKQVFAKFIPKLPNIGGAFNDVIGGSVKKVKSDFVDYIKKKMKDLNPFGGGASPSGKGAKAWRPAILAAAARMNESVSEKEVQGIIAQIHRESGGNEKIVQSSAVWDINTANGNPARGLLQYIPQTFNAYKMKGHGNIYSGYDQLLAFFNNTRWRTDLPYGKRGWGPRGKRKYKNGTNFHVGGSAMLGDGWEYEPFLLPDGRLGLSPDVPTVFNNLPAGTKVWSNIQDFVQSTNQSQKTDAMKLLALVGKKLEQQSSAPSNNAQTSSYQQLADHPFIQKILAVLEEQSEILKAIAMKDPIISVLLNNKEVAKAIFKDVTKLQDEHKDIKRRFKG
ncbi:hypothetical protein AS180_05235 [Priestia veravalensis]|uniref:Phage tail tape measure protein n=1 Tax=Priestia veravalensis TaxID=1414648 RepID=A0A0V8JPB8_9BACI|nr:MULTISPECIES: hypothetical protein [Priestia]KSU88905.1 hypothetical protein AS180_05235 [Priestia veravalensis]SCC02600.1 Phage-related protein [Priestia flexa]